MPVRRRRSVLTSILLPTGVLPEAAPAAPPDDPTGTDGTRLQIFDCNGSTAQRCSRPA